MDDPLKGSSVTNELIKWRISGLHKEVRSFPAELQSANQVPIHNFIDVKFVQRAIVRRRAVSPQRAAALLNVKDARLTIEDLAVGQRDIGVGRIGLLTLGHHKGVVDAEVGFCGHFKDRKWHLVCQILHSEFKCPHVQKAIHEPIGGRPLGAPVRRDGVPS